METRIDNVSFGSGNILSNGRIECWCILFIFRYGERSFYRLLLPVAFEYVRKVNNER